MEGSPIDENNNRVLELHADEGMRNPFQNHRASAGHQAYCDLSPPMDLGSKFTEEVAAALRGQGFSVEILDGIARPVDEPDNSSPYSLSYIPRANASRKIWVNGQEESLYDEEMYYGVDAKKGKEWAIVPDPKFAYRSFDAVMPGIDEVRSAFASGATAEETGRRRSGAGLTSSKVAALQLARTQRFHRNARDFEVRPAQQLIDADEGARRELTVKISAINGIEFVVELQIRAVHGDGH